MIRFFIALISVGVPMYGVYNFTQKLPAQNFVDLSAVTKSVLFHPTWDVMLMFFIVAALFLYAASTGRGRVTLIILNTYIAYGVISFLLIQQKLFDINVPHDSIPKLIIFGVLFFVILFFLFKSQIGQAIRSNMRDMAWWNMIVQSVMGAGLICSSIYTFLSPAEIDLLAPITKKLIGTPEAQLLWIFAPFLWLWVLNVLKRE